MKYKLLAVDVDGTLLRRDGSIHPDDREAIARMGRAGVTVTVVTGRLYSGTREVARSVGLSGPIACVDGSHIVDLRDDGALHYRGITGAEATSLRDILERHHTASFLFAQDTIVHDAGGAAFAAYVRTWSPKVDVVDHVGTHPFWEHELGVMAVVAIGAERDIHAASAEVGARLGASTMTITFPVPRLACYALLIRASGSTKGTAIEWLARHHGCTPAEVVAVGDWLNDVPMFQTAGRSFAMGQAPPIVKATATDQLDADSHGGGGIAEAVRRAWGS